MAISIEKQLERADKLYAAANKMQKRNPNGAKKLKVKANLIENKAVSAVGRKPRVARVSTNSSGGGRNTPLNWY